MSKAESAGTNLEAPSEGESLSQETFSIFILKSQAQAMVSAEQYLRNRKWIVGSSANLKEALAYIIQKQPQYVFLSADHTHKKIRILPKLLAQAFPCRVIGFAERGGPLSMSVMTDMGLEYNLYPPVSGPAIQRLILKIRKDDDMKSKGLSGDGKPLAEKETGGNDVYTFKNDQNGPGGNMAFDARSALSQLMASEGADGAIGGGMSGPGLGTDAGGGAIGMSGPQGPNFYNAQQSASAEMNAPSAGSPTHYNPQGSDFASGSPQGSGFYNPQQGMGPDGKPLPPGTEGPALGESFADWAERMRKAAAANEGDPRPKEDEGGSGGFGDTAGNGLRAKAPILESDYQRKEKRRGYRIESDPRYQKSQNNDSIIVRGTQQAIDETMNQKGRPPVEILKSTNVACILIQSTRFSGYLICAMGANRKVDQSLMATVQTRLVKFLKANGEDMREDEVLGMKIQEVDFQDWALEQADFLRKSVHDGEEIAMAFFPAASVDTQLEESISKKMLQMKLDELREDSPLEFDLYIYMPENNKYLLYTPQGTPIYGKQKDRLQSHGVTHMHLKKESLRDVKKYRAQNFLNDKITAYKAAQKIKDSDSND